MLKSTYKNTEDINDNQSLTTTVILDKSVPKNQFGNIAIITEENGKTYSPTKYGEYDNVDGIFLKSQSENKSWFKISDGAKATIYYNKEKGLYISDTTSLANPVRIFFWKYYVDWVNKNDTKRNPPATNPFK